MLVVDKERYSKNEFMRRYNKLALDPVFRNPERKVYALCLKNPFEVVSLVLYLRERNASVLLLNSETPLETAAHRANQNGCAALVFGEASHVIRLEGGELLERGCLLQYTSGTTDGPKCIGRPWIEIQQEIEEYNRSIADSGGCTPIILVPVSHSFGLITGVLAAVYRNVEPVVITNKNPRFAVSTIRATNHSLVFAVPFLLQILQALRKDVFAFDRVVSSGAPLTESLLAQIRSVANVVYQQYGCTELGCISMMANPRSPLEVGRPLRHITVSTAGTKDSPKEIIASLSGKHVLTRDIGYFDDVGVLHVSGRVDDVINVSGQKVIPFEVEEVISSMPGVLDTVIYRTKHPVWGEAAKALVVTREPLSPQEVKKWCMKFLPNYKVPHVIELVAEIPRMPSGKISRKFLEEREREDTYEA